MQSELFEKEYQTRNEKVLDKEFDKNYCFKVISDEEYLWDLRTWLKLKNQYTKKEIKEQIIKWLKDVENDVWSFNCTHCMYCVERLLKRGIATMDEIVELFLNNNKIKYADEIGSWFKE